MVSLKAQNYAYIVPYALLQAAGLAWVAGKVSGAGEAIGLAEAAVGSGVVCAAVTLAHRIASGVLGDRPKAALVFWRIKHILPGCRAFTAIGPSDPRVDMEALRARLGPLPEAPEDQNKLWYGIYGQHQSKPQVRDSHAGYLLMRELASLTLIFVPLLPAASLVLGSSVRVAALYVAAELLLYVAVALAGQHYGRRMVANVLALEFAEVSR